MLYTLDKTKYHILWINVYFFLNAHWFQFFVATNILVFCYNTVSMMCECASRFEGYNVFSLQLVRVFCKRNYWYCFIKLLKLCGYLKLVSKFISIRTMRKTCVRCVLFFLNKDAIVNQLCKSFDCQIVVFTRRSRFLKLKWNLSIVYKTKTVW